MKKFILSMMVIFMIAAVLPSNTMAATSESTLMSIAKKYLGIPYKYGGTTTSGFDCSGYTLTVFREAGVSLPRTTGEQYKEGYAVSKSQLQVGDLVFFNTSGKGVSHNGIFIGDNKFIHSSTSRGIMISSIYDPYYWGSKYIGARRVADFSSATQVATTTKPQVSAPAYVTRAEIAEVLAKELGLVGQTNYSAFADVPMNHPKLAYINAVAKAGIFTGSDGKFKPNDPLTRSHMAKVLVESFNLQGIKNPDFKDVSSNFWASDYIGTLFYNEVTTGYANGYYGVNDSLTELQFGKFIDRVNE